MGKSRPASPLCRYCVTLFWHFLAPQGGPLAQWANYSRQADIGFFKFFDFMIHMASFNVQTNKKERIFQFSERNVQKFGF
jgi:hypothetical protein